MRPEHLNPPAIVKSVDSLIEISSRCSQLTQAIGRNARQNLAHALELGNLLERLRPLCKVGEWESKLDAIGLNRQRAHDYMAIAKLSDDQIAGCESIADARRLIKDQSTPVRPRADVQDNAGGKSRPPDGGQNEPGEDYEEDETQPHTESVLIKCETCTRRGARPGCPECEKLQNTPTRPAPERTAHTRGPKKKKQGEEILNWRLWHKQFEIVVQIPDRIAEVIHSEKHALEYKAFQRLMNEAAKLLVGWDNRIRKTFQS